jgi:hypothetical protein
VPKPVKPVAIDFEGIRRRVSVIPVGLDVNSATLSPDGKCLAFVASAAGESLRFHQLSSAGNRRP